MSLCHAPATPADAAAITALRNAAANDLTARYGHGPWSGHCTEKGVLFDLRNSSVFIARERNRIVATFLLANRKPWAINRAYFTPVTHPLYLLSMAVAPTDQRRGLGRRCLEEARKLATNWRADAIFLDAFDHPAGAGEFYRKCGYREVGRVVYRGAPLIYFELLLPKAP